MRRIRNLVDAYTFSWTSTVMQAPIAEAKSKTAFVPTPSASAPEPEPASVVTRPPGVTVRMRLFQSVMNTAPLAGDTAMPAACTVVSVEAAPAGVTTRTPCASTTNALPDASTAIMDG